MCIRDSLSTKNYVDQSIDALSVVNVDSVAISQGSVDIDFSDGPFFVHNIDGDVTYTFSNLSAGREISIKIFSTGLNNLSFPAVKFMGTVPPTIADNKTAILTAKSFSSSISDCVVTYEVEA